MADDARTEARRRIAVAIHRTGCACLDPGHDPPDGDPSSWDLADTVLELFPDVTWGHLGSLPLLIAVAMVVAALAVLAAAFGVIIDGEIDLRRHDRTMRQLNERPEEPRTDA